MKENAHFFISRFPFPPFPISISSFLVLPVPFLKGSVYSYDSGRPMISGYSASRFLAIKIGFGCNATSRFLVAQQLG